MKLVARFSAAPGTELLVVSIVNDIGCILFGSAALVLVLLNY